MPEHALRDAEREAASRAHQDDAAQAATDIGTAGGEDVPLLPQESGGGIREPEPGDVVLPHGLDEGGGEAAEESGDPAVGGLEQGAELGDRRYGGGQRGEDAREGDERADVARVGELRDGIERGVLLPPHRHVHVRHGLEVDGEGRERLERPRSREGLHGAGFGECPESLGRGSDWAVSPVPGRLVPRPGGARLTLGRAGGEILPPSQIRNL